MSTDARTVRYTFARHWLGELLMAADESGLCALLPGDDRDELVADLTQRMGGSPCIADDGALAEYCDPLIFWLDNPSSRLNLPLAPRGTPFQQQVWQALRKIPAGETIDYAGLAQRIDRPSAARAVAGACAANPLAVVIPCHRVVRRDGDLSGYRWGIARKKALLEREGSLARPLQTA